MSISICVNSIDFTFVLIFCYLLNVLMGAKGDWDFCMSDLVKKTLMELIFNPYGKFW